MFGKRIVLIFGFKWFLFCEELKRFIILVFEDILEFDMNKRGNLLMFVGKCRVFFFVGKCCMYFVVGRGGNMNNLKFVGK